MSSFLSEEWFTTVNEKLRSAGPVPFEGPVSVFRVVLEFGDAPATSAHAITFTLDQESASVAPGDHLAADAVIRLSYSDASDLTAGALESAKAIREGRIKVAGNLHALLPLSGWLGQLREVQN
jgi:putative sterol carrier protein